VIDEDEHGAGARRCAYGFMETESADESEVADAARYRWLGATKFPLNAKPKARLDAEIAFEMRRVGVPLE